MRRESAEQVDDRPRVVDLSTADDVDLDELWQYEVEVWRERLLWDISAAAAAFRRAMARHGVSGKAVQVRGRAVGLTYYAVGGRLGVIAGLVMSPVCGAAAAGEALVRATVDAVRSRGVQRIEAPFVSIDHPWLAAAFERQGFRTYWRTFQRLTLPGTPKLQPRTALVRLAPWQASHLDEAAHILRAAYDDTFDAQISQRYRTAEGCRAVLDEIVHQGGCGSLVAEASALAYHRGHVVGFIAVTEIAPDQGHVAQVAVLPEYQGQGIGRSLLDNSLARLADRQFDTLSLIVSQGNDHALHLYRATGFHNVLAFPVFTWER